MVVVCIFTNKKAHNNVAICATLFFQLLMQMHMVLGILLSMPISYKLNLPELISLLFGIECHKFVFEQDYCIRINNDADCMLLALLGNLCG